MSYDSALNFMQAAEVYGGKNGTVPDFPPRVIYALSAPSTGPAIRAAIEERIASGELKKASEVEAEVKRLKAEAKAKAEEAQRAAARAEAADEQLALLQQQDVEREARSEEVRSEKRGPPRQG